MLFSVYEDAEVYEWIVWAGQHGTSFVQAVAQAALIADVTHYNLIRPVLLELMKEWPSVG